LPPVESVAKRLETQKRFTEERAKLSAKALEESMRFAGVIDQSNNILPVRAGEVGAGVGEAVVNAREGGAGAEIAGKNHGDKDHQVHHDQLPTRDTLGVEIPVGDDRHVSIQYPRDLTPAEAKKVGNVLAAVVG
jgi:hypothetical protein